MIESHHHRGLVLEENPLLRQMFAIYLKHLGYTIEVCNELSRATRLLQDPYDFALLDLNAISRMNLALLALIQNFRNRNPNAPIILYGESRSKQPYLLAEDTKHYYVLAKPFPLVELRQVLEQSLY